MYHSVSLFLNIWPDIVIGELTFILYFFSWLCSECNVTTKIAKKK